MIKTLLLWATLGALLGVRVAGQTISSTIIGSETSSGSATATATISSAASTSPSATATTGTATATVSGMSASPSGLPPSWSSTPVAPSPQASATPPPLMVTTIAGLTNGLATSLAPARDYTQATSGVVANVSSVAVDPVSLNLFLLTAAAALGPLPQVRVVDFYSRIITTLGNVSAGASGLAVTLDGYFVLVAEPLQSRIRVMPITVGARAGVGDRFLNFSSGVQPCAVAVDSSGAPGSATRVVVGDCAGTIQLVDYMSGDASVLASSIPAPWSVAVNSVTGTIYATSADSPRVYQVTRAGAVSYLANSAGVEGVGTIGPALASPLDGSLRVAYDAVTHSVYVSEGKAAHKVRRIDLASGAIGTVAGSGAIDGPLNDYFSALSAPLYAPLGMASDGRGTLYVATKLAHRLRAIILDTASYSAGCPSGWARPAFSTNRCFKYLSAAGNRGNASLACSRLLPGASLASMASDTDAFWLTTRSCGLEVDAGDTMDPAQPFFWTGGYKTVASGASRVSGWAWQDGSSTAWLLSSAGGSFYWNPLQPDEAGGPNSEPNLCVTFPNGLAAAGLSDVSGSASVGACCSWQLPTPTPSATPSATGTATTTGTSSSTATGSATPSSSPLRQSCRLDQLLAVANNRLSESGLTSLGLGWNVVAAAGCTGPVAIDGGGQQVVGDRTSCALECGGAGVASVVTAAGAAPSGMAHIATAMLRWGPIAYVCALDWSNPTASAPGRWRPLPNRTHVTLMRAFTDPLSVLPATLASARLAAANPPAVAPSSGNGSFCVPIVAAVPRSLVFDACGDTGRVRYKPPTMSPLTASALVSARAATNVTAPGGAWFLGRVSGFAWATSGTLALYPEATAQFETVGRMVSGSTTQQVITSTRLGAVIAPPGGGAVSAECAGVAFSPSDAEAAVPSPMLSFWPYRVLQATDAEIVTRIPALLSDVRVGLGLQVSDRLASSGSIAVQRAGSSCALPSVDLFIVALPVLPAIDEGAGAFLTQPWSVLAPIKLGTLVVTAVNATADPATWPAEPLALQQQGSSGGGGLQCGYVDLQPSSQLGVRAPKDWDAGTEVFVLSDALPPLNLRPVFPVPVTTNEVVTIECESSDRSVASLSPTRVEVTGSNYRDVGTFTLTGVFQRSNARAGTTVWVTVGCTVASRAVSLGGAFPAYASGATRDVKLAFRQARWPLIGNALVTYGSGASAVARGVLTRQPLETFTILTNGRATVTFYADGSSLSRPANATPGYWFSSTSDPGVTFDSSTEVWIGALRCGSGSVGNSGRSFTCTLPTFREVCGNVTDCPQQAVTIRNALPLPSLPTSDAAAVLRTVLSCPPFCPGGGSVVGVSSSAAAFRPLPVPVFSNVTNATSGVITLSIVQVPSTLGSAGGGGVSYLQACIGGNWTDPLTGACANASDPRSANCAFGAADDCRPCPAGALCPGGYRAIPRPGFTTSGGGGSNSGGIVQCAVPSYERCVGWDARSDVVVCGDAFRGQGCGACADGAFPTIDGSCELCPRTDISPLITAAVILVVSVAGVALAVVSVAKLAISYAGAGTLTGTTWRAAELGVWTWSILQIQAQVSKAAAPGLPPFAVRIGQIVRVFNFEALGIHPRCIGAGGPLRNTELVLSVVTIAGLAQVALLLNYRRWCRCSLCGLGRRKSALLLPSLDAAVLEGKGEPALAAAQGGTLDAGSYRGAITPQGSTTRAGPSGAGVTDASTAGATMMSNPSFTHSRSRRHGHTRTMASVNLGAVVPGQVSNPMLRPSFRTDLDQLQQAKNLQLGVIDASSDAPSKAPALDSTTAATAAAATARLLAEAIRALPWHQRIGAHADVVKPYLRKTLFLVLTLLYPVACNSVFAALSCRDSSVRVDVYRSMAGDGSALRKAGIPLQPPSADGSALASSSTAGASAWLVDPDAARVIRVSVLASDPYVVCGEGAHIGVQSWAVAVLVFFVLGYPLLTYYYISRRAIPSVVALSARRETRPDGSVKMVAPAPGGRNAALFDLAAARRRDWERQWAYVTGPGLSPAVRCARALAVLLFCAGRRHSGPRGGRPMPSLDWLQLPSLNPVQLVRWARARTRAARVPSAGAASPGGGSGDPPSLGRGDTGLGGMGVQGNPMLRSGGSSGDPSPRLSTPRFSVGALLLPSDKEQAPPVNGQAAGDAASDAAVSSAGTSTTSPGQCDGFTTTSTATLVLPLPSTSRISAVTDPLRRQWTAVFGVPDPRILTADDMVDGCVGLGASGDVSLSHFTGGDMYRPSQFGFRMLDLALLLFLSVVVNGWPAPQTAAEGLGRCVFVWLLLGVTAILFLRWPFGPQDGWKGWVKLYHMCLLALITGLNYVTIVINIHFPFYATERAEREALDGAAAGYTLSRATGAQARAQAEATVSGVSLASLRASRASLALATFALSILLFAVLLLGFTVSLFQGIRAEVEEEEKEEGAPQQAQHTGWICSLAVRWQRNPGADATCRAAPCASPQENEAVALVVNESHSQVAVAPQQQP